MKFGFTGTRKGCTTEQITALRALMRGFTEASIFGHGDCVGADADAHKIVREVSAARIILHPPTKGDLRAYCKADEERTPAPYLVRNRHIVDEADVLIACPAGPETSSGGTWSTVRYARRHNVEHIVIMPNGGIERVRAKPAAS